MVFLHQKPNLTVEERGLLWVLRDITGLEFSGASGQQVGNSVDWEALLHLMRMHSIVPMGYCMAKDSKGWQYLPETFRASLRRAYLLNTARNLKLFHELSKVLHVLNNDKVPTLLLKGAHLAGGVYENAGCRTMSDIDILFKKQDLSRAQRCLSKAGYYPVSSRISLDIHWDLSLYIEKFNIDLDATWERAQSVHIGSSQALGLAPEDLILHLCLHCSFHHESLRFAGLRTLCDIRAVINRHAEQLDWTCLAQRARAWRIGNAVFLLLLLARDLIKVEIPDGFLCGLKPADFAEQVYERAVGQVIRGPMEASYLSPYFWQLWAGIPLRKKLKGLLRLVLPPPAFVSQKYPARHKTLKNYIYYLVRTRDNVRRYCCTAWKILRRDEATFKTLQRNKRSLELTEWLLTQ